MEITDFSEADLKEIVYRSAKPEDYEGVLAISQGLYGGRDIVPAMYHTYLKDPLRVCMIATCKGKVVVFASSKMVDNGQTMEGEAGRTHISVRGKGVFDRLRQQQFFQVIQPKFPNIKRIRAVAPNSDKLSDIIRLDVVPRTLRSSFDLAWHISADTLEQALGIFQKQGKPSVKRRAISMATETNLKEIFTNKDFRASFIPSGVLVRDSHTFHLDFLENIPLLFHDRCENIFISRDDHGILASISCGTGIEMGVSMETFRYTIDYYGKSELDLLNGHIIKHMSDIPRLFRNSPTAKNIYINLFVLADTFKSSDLKELMNFISNDLQIVNSKTIQRPQQIVLLNKDAVNFYENKAKI